MCDLPTIVCDLPRLFNMWGHVGIVDFVGDSGRAERGDIWCCC